jgi:putative inorganic carbon (HCO3(-)) transporter
VSGLFSIAVAHSLLGACLFVLVVTRRQLQVPPIWPPLFLFFAATVASLFASGEIAAGWPQVKKFYVCLLLIALSSTLHGIRQARWLLLSVAAAGTVSGGWSLVQFYWKWRQIEATRQPFYQSYIADRTTGFMSHWMTFSGQIMIVLLVLAAFLFFSRHWRKRLPVTLLAAACLTLALLLNLTRNVWAAAAVGGLYLLWFWKRWLILLTPVLVLGLVLAAPDSVGRRITSIYKPDPALDTNRHREVLRQTGWRMIQANPWLGVGPMQVKKRFLDFVKESDKPIPANWWYDHLHNVYLHYAAERGLPALAALLWFFGRILYDLLGALRRLPAGRGEARWILQAAIAVTIGVMVAGWWEVNLGDSEVLALFLTVIVCGYAAIGDKTELEHA